MSWVNSTLPLPVNCVALPFSSVKQNGHPLMRTRESSKGCQITNERFVCYGNGCQQTSGACLSQVNKW